MGLAYRCDTLGTVVQLRLEGLACSKLAPYDRWESFRDLSRELWSRYAAIASPSTVRRVAVRFINQIPVPAPIEDFREFVRVYPSTPWNLSSPPAGVFLQLQRVLAPDVRLVVNETVIASDSGAVTIVLDFDVFAEAEQAYDCDAMWNLVERLHVSADEAFESSITDRVRREIG